MSARIVLATGNSGKLREFRALLADSDQLRNLDLDSAVVDAATAGVGEIPETGVTFTENSLLKARAVAEMTGLPAVADDSGLSVDVLGGAPGIFSARWAGARSSDENNRRLLLEQLCDIPAEHRTAAFVCVASLVIPGHDGAPAAEFTAEGRLEGTLLTEEHGSGGFGYDPILQPVGDSRSCAELSMAEKNAISHRGKAFRALAHRIVEVLV
ncbi:RdgB/HAM1 family non-canonical purine NTP pyrophosphatase [Nesterenkonia haasae]|uniref:RdgB/HAM1 family non-canonical purine NTP pyrophosphatase n=1 Tax=Nesterenkonia haasae TaxID=2587813 RepID=UPI0013910297|nr:RdgB/HAM1 family non-canonical purine NTP pyrophosphatase [Nesterenkonia haasae]NDK30786.1 RdgB/HAM1 family non-canonical purine NTP pyrophosphatase [Nesterenkonia haasae]